MGPPRTLGAVALALGLAVSGCSAPGGADEEAGLDLSGTWVLVSGRSADGPLVVMPDTRITLTLDRDSMGGKAPCNDYGADYELRGSSFDVPGPGMDQTLMDCGAEPEELESAYLSALMRVDTAVRKGDFLAMTGEGTALEFRLDEPWPRADVVGHRWRLVRWTDDSGVHHRPSWEPGLRPFIRFGDGDATAGRVHASSGCRRLAGRWRLWHGAPHISRARWHGDCPDRLVGQEQAASSALSEPVVEVRDRAGRTELVLRYAHANSPAELVYRR